VEAFPISPRGWRFESRFPDEDNIFDSVFDDDPDWFESLDLDPLKDAIRGWGFVRISSSWPTRMALWPRNHSAKLT